MMSISFSYPKMTRTHMKVGTFQKDVQYDKYDMIVSQKSRLYLLILVTYLYSPHCQYISPNLSALRAAVNCSQFSLNGCWLEPEVSKFIKCCGEINNIPSTTFFMDKLKAYLKFQLHFFLALNMSYDTC